MAGIRVRFIRDTWGDGRLYISYNDMLAVLANVQEEVSDTVRYPLLTSRDRAVIATVAESLKHEFQDVRDRSGI